MVKPSNRPITALLLLVVTVEAASGANNKEAGHGD